MRVAVIGAGVVGVTTAWELAVDGHDVTVFERRGSAAAEASFAAAGLVSPGRVAPWVAPDYSRQIIGQLLGRATAMRVHPGLRPSELGWLRRSRRAGRAGTAQADQLRLQRLAVYSLQRLRGLTGALKLQHERGDGNLVLFRDAADEAAAGPEIARLTEQGVRVESVDAGRCRVIEPGLGEEAPLHGGMFLPDDEVGNCRQFATLLRGEAQRAGVKFRFHTEVQQIRPGPAPQLVHLHTPPDEAGVLTNAGAESEADTGHDTVPMPLEAATEAFGAVVVCAALGAADLLRPHGLLLPMQAVWGYSVTAPIRRVDAHGEVGPRAAVVDARHAVTISRLGARVRVAGGTEIGGVGGRHDPMLVQRLYKMLHDWFPGCALLAQAQVWKGARPMLPDGLPVLGPSSVAGVWVNLGHGDHGWALACGSARLLADAIAGRRAAIDTDGLGLARLEG